jgi:osmotically-inducible protein OsmY
MDDSERSYGYSRDIYHGRRGAGGDYGERMVRGNAGPYFYPDWPHRETSYEYGAERGLNDVEELSPEEAAMHVRGGGGQGGVRKVGRGRYDYGRDGGARQVESQTWDIEGPFRGRGPRGYHRSDERIHEDVCDRLEAHGEVDASDVEVTVAAGEVTLAGTVPDRRTKRLAEDVADSVRGVLDVHNLLTLARPDGGS